MPDEDWREARLALKVRFLPSFDRHQFSHTTPMQQLKSGPIARVKADRESKKVWNDIKTQDHPEGRPADERASSDREHSKSSNGPRFIASSNS